MVKDIFIKSAEFTLKGLIESCKLTENEDCGFNVYLHDFCDVIILLNKLARNIDKSAHESDQSLRLNYIFSLFRNIECNKHISLSLYDMIRDTLIDSSNHSFHVLESRYDIRDVKSYVYEFISLINSLRNRCLNAINDMNEENNYFRKFFFMNMKVIKEISDNLIKAIHANDYAYFSCEILSLSLLFNDVMKLQLDKLHDDKFRSCVLELSSYINDLLFKNEDNQVFTKLNDVENLKTIIKVFRDGVNQSKAHSSNRVFNMLSLLYDDVNRSIIWLTDYESLIM